MLLNLKRVLRSGFINFWRTPAVSIASVVTLTVTLYVIGALVLASAYLNSALDDIRNRVDISVALKPDVTETTALELKTELERLPEVKKVEYRSREQELADFRERHKDNDLIIQSLEEVGNPFGARLNISAVDPSHYESVAKFFESDSALSSAGETIVDQVSFKKNIVDRLVNVIRTAETMGLAITLILVFISVVVTFNTISLAIYISREEISLMKLVGAGNSYVRGPFVVEGVIAGFLSSLLSLALLYPSTIWMRNETSGLYGGINMVNYFLDNFASIFLLLLASGVFLGAAASFLAVRKHLKKV